MKQIIRPVVALSAFCFFLLIISSCRTDENMLPGSEMTGQPILDVHGRTLILHGLNTSSSAKSHPERQPWITEADVAREAEVFGFNAVRYLIFWDGVEPEQGIYDETYLDKVQQRVEWYTSRDMYVLLDMHQDLYSIVFGGDGAPDWALQTNGHTFQGADGPWWLANIDPAVVACWTNFWSYTDYQYLQDHYIDMWKQVAMRFRDNPYVIGYDLMNEPWGGDIVKTIVTGEFEKFQLSKFYDRLIPALREVDPDKYFFFEPAPAPVTFGSPSRLPAIIDERSDSRLVYAPHCYPYDTHEGAGYTAGARKQLRDWERERRSEVKKHGHVPLLCGEFGLSPSNDGYDEYLQDVLGMFDRNGWHWTYWSSDPGGWGPLNPDGTESLIMSHLVRTYPKATSGRLKGFSFDPVSGEFVMQYVPMDTGRPTEIFVPERHYPDGYDLEVENSGNWSDSYDAATQTLQLNADASEEILTVRIVRR